jgi:Fic family protein
LTRYIYDLPDWPHFLWSHEILDKKLAAVRFRQGELIGRMKALGFPLQEQAVFQTLTLDVLKSSEIEGEMLDKEQVRSSVAGHLGMDIGGLAPVSRDIEGVVAMILDATQSYTEPLSKERLFGWHASLFPSGYSDLKPIKVGTWRDGPVEVTSGPVSRKRVYFEGPPADRVEQEMAVFLDWFNRDDGTDLVLRAAIAHLWFVTIHPFEDGNGRIARALADMMLSRSEGSSQRFYSMSAQIRNERDVVSGSGT